MLDTTTAAEYLERIGAVRPEKPDVEGLRHIQERHLFSVPFENIDFHTGDPIHLDEKILEKIVDRRRGGACYELNLALSWLLEHLGYGVEIAACRTYNDTTVGPPLGHMALRVTAEDRPWLVDVGFGHPSRHPLALDTEEPQTDPHGTYRLVPSAAGSGTDLLLNGRLQYRIDTVEVRAEHFAPMLWWYRMCPESPVHQYVFTVLSTPRGRVVLKEDRLTVTEDGVRTSERLRDDAAVLAAYREHFGFDLPHPPSRSRRYAGPPVEMYLD
ncbi:arylamine N-acetyltransferase family protein [Streptomyces sp. URMC 123]|uniref:arylamine N-acetyltransferase family protein n=1 Tax=Streptomyces sp. URMC 123 TaxID=3423403 RepID=UPI003F1C38C7